MTRTGLSTPPRIPSSEPFPSVNWLGEQLSGEQAPAREAPGMNAASSTAASSRRFIYSAGSAVTCSPLPTTHNVVASGAYPSARRPH